MDGPALELSEIPAYGIQVLDCQVSEKKNDYIIKLFLQYFTVTSVTAYILIKDTILCKHVAQNHYNSFMLNAFLAKYDDHIA
jgi:hypothetical protein